MNVHILPVTWAAREAALRRVRHEVFIIEQNVPEELEWDTDDPLSAHFVALDSAGLTLGCARLTPTGQIGRMAVLAQHRGRGIGAELLGAAIAAACERGLPEVFLHAQCHAEGFYRKAGFLPQGEIFREAGIDHLHMTLALPLAFEPPTIDVEGVHAAVPAATSRTSGVESATVAPVSFTDESSAAAALLECLAAPRRTLDLLSPMLDPALFDVPAVSDALSAFARRAAAVRVRILIYSTRMILSRSHRLIETARRLDQKILLRRVPEEFAGDERSFVVWDHQGYWLQPAADAYHGLANGADPVLAGRLQERFDYLWEKSHSDPDLRLRKL